MKRIDWQSVTQVLGQTIAGLNGKNVSGKPNTDEARLKMIRSKLRNIERKIGDLPAWVAR